MSEYDNFCDLIVRLYPRLEKVTEIVTTAGQAAGDELGAYCPEIMEGIRQAYLGADTSQQGYFKAVLIRSVREIVKEALRETETARRRLDDPIERERLGAILDELDKQRAEYIRNTSPGIYKSMDRDMKDRETAEAMAARMFDAALPEEIINALDEWIGA